MPSFDRRHGISEDEARHRAAEHAFARTAIGQRLGQVGLEPELFPIYVNGNGRPAGRLPLTGGCRSGVIEVIDCLAVRKGRIHPRQAVAEGPAYFELEGGGRITFEPGAQIEHSTRPHPSATAALADVDEVLAVLRQGFAQRGVVLAAIGLDIWHDVKDIPQYLRTGRYISQAAYYEKRGPWGRIMMRHTASLQINLDLGPEGVWQERWRIANLIAPLVTATFATSPSQRAVCERARAWQGLDPTRSGFPVAFVCGSGNDPRSEWAEAAVHADVMLARLPDGRYEPGDPGFSFARWINEGHPLFGWPTADDLDYHLSTLFFEVRPRGYLELRGGEALPDQWRAAPVVLTSALLYDDDARTGSLADLEAIRPRLPELWARAAEHGVHDDELRRLASTVWERALVAAERLPSGFVNRASIDTARRFLETFTLRGRTPGDELAELQQQEPAQALAWASSTTLS
jgi:glutamate--cysteine ligase